MATKQHDKQTHRFWADRKEKLSVSGVSVAADWFILLGFLVFLLAALLVSSWLLFRDVSSSSSLDASVDAALRTNVNEAQLDRVVERFGVRKEQFTNLSDGFTFSATVQPLSASATSTPEQAPAVEVPFDDTR